jgi:hypothetical protein
MSTRSRGCRLCIRDLLTPKLELTGEPAVIDDDRVDLSRQIVADS